jgi:type IV pilus assembly protein PilW
MLRDSIRRAASMRITRTTTPRRRQAGLTLIELMVALVLGLLIAAASVSALIVARQGFRSVDGSAQLRENARFAASLIQRITVQAGFENAAYGLFSDPKDPGLSGFDDAIVTTGSLPGGLTHGNRTSGCGSVTDTSCLNGSDVLIVRYWGVSRGGVADGTMINCSGAAEPEGADRAFSIFHVVRSAAGEPTLACSHRNTAGVWATVPLVNGVEAFQVLYGVDTLTAAGTAAPTPVDGDSVADRYLTATELDTIPTTTVIDNWRRVRSLRVGLVIRGPVPDAVDRAATAAASMPVLGEGFTNAADTGSALNVAADGRLRQRLVFTVHLRNAQLAP